MNRFLEWLRSTQPKTRARTFAPSARELYPILRRRLNESRPVVGHTETRVMRDGTVRPGRPVFGAPTFRNVIENGEHK